VGRHRQVRVNVASGTPASVAQLTQPLRDAPGESAALLDVDGTLAPIVPVPADASVPQETRDALRRLARHLALVACVSGRRAVEARRVVGLDELTYVGNHGLEVLRAGSREAELDSAAAAGARKVRDFVEAQLEDEVEASGLRLEDKGPIQALHWRGAADPDAAEQGARRIADRAELAGLEPRWGRKVLEIRPAARVDKGTAVRRLLEGPAIEIALFAGDDRTDLDAFRALRSMREAKELRHAVCIGIASDEAPTELAASSDVVLDGPAALTTVLSELADACRPRATG
jgi:trehalose 6-phosphate phosphatase